MKRSTFWPILLKEFRGYIRGYRAAVVLSIYLGLLLLALWWLYDSITGQVAQGSPLLSAQIGQLLFIGLALAAQALTVFLAPAMTVNAISSEYENATIDVLLTTPLESWQVVLSKLLVGLAFMLLLLICSLPLFSVVVLFGGVELLDIGRVLITLLITAVVGCLLGLFCSAVTRQTYTATILCYALLIAVIGGSFFAANLWSIMHSQTAAPPTYVFVNPLSAMASVLANIQPPEASVIGQLRPVAIVGMLAQGSVTQSGGQLAVLPLYRATWLLYTILSVLFFWICLWLLRTIQRRHAFQFGRTDLVFAGLLVLMFVGAWLARDWWGIGLGQAQFEGGITIV